jgi:ABC-type phosphate transport system auxiliary subunit
MKLSELQNLIREEIQSILSEKDQAEINAEKEEMDARVANTDTQIKALQKKLGVLKKKSQEVAKQKPDETGA